MLMEKAQECNVFRGKIANAQKGAPGPRRGQKSTLLSKIPIHELTFCP